MLFPYLFLFDSKVFCRNSLKQNFKKARFWKRVKNNIILILRLKIVIETFILHYHEYNSCVERLFKTILLHLARLVDAIKKSTNDVLAAHVPYKCIDESLRTFTILPTSLTLRHLK